MAQVLLEQSSIHAEIGRPKHTSAVHIYKVIITMTDFLAHDTVQILEMCTADTDAPASAKSAYSHKQKY